MTPTDPNPYSRLDPRVKLLMLAAAGLCAFLTRTLAAQLAALVVALLVALVARQRRTVIHVLIATVPLIAFLVWSGNGGRSMWIYYVRFLAFFVVKFTPPAIFFILLSRLENLSSVIHGLERMRVPRQVTLPLSVAIRFVPSLRYEYASIRDAMRLRGIEPTARRFYAHPAQTAEITIVPLLMRTLKIAEELSISAMTRGIELKGRKEFYASIEWRGLDTIVAVVTILTGALVLLLDLLPV